MNSNAPSFSRLALLILASAALLLPACASGGAAYRPIVDGPRGAQYSADLSGCRSVAETRNYNNSDTRTSAAIGAGLGGLLALADEDGGEIEDFIGGAIIGSLFGAGEGALETRRERKQIVMNCMAGRGHRVVG